MHVVVDTEDAVDAKKIEEWPEAHEVVVIKDGDDEADQDKREVPTEASGWLNGRGSKEEEDIDIPKAPEAPMVD